MKFPKSAKIKFPTFGGRTSLKHNGLFDPVHRRGAEVLNVEERFMIREMHRKGLSISEIARQTGHDRKTVRKVINGSLEPAPKERRRRKRKIDPYVPYLLQRIAVGVLNARKLYQEIKALGYEGKESQVRSLVQPYRPRRQSVATVRYETEPGEQAQVDWASFGFIVHQGKRRRLYAFVMTLGWSRAMYVEFTVSTDMTTWLRCHVHAFEYFGGVPEVILHDNLKTAVVERSSEGGVRWQARYLDFAEYYGFVPRACQPYRAQTKGKVESGIAYLRGNFWVGLEYVDLADLNRQATEWLNTIANVRIHGTTGEVPFKRLAEEGLAPIYDKPDYDTSLVVHRRCSRDCLISYQGNYYSAPADYAGERMMVKVTEGGELFVINEYGEIVASHSLAAGSNQRVVIAEHHANIPFSSSRPRRAGAQQVAVPDLTPIPWPDAPSVEARPLGIYQDLVELGP
jgi:transposase